MISGMQKQFWFFAIVIIGCSEFSVIAMVSRVPQFLRNPRIAGLLTRQAENVSLTRSGGLPLQVRRASGWHDLSGKAIQGLPGIELQNVMQRPPVYAIGYSVRNKPLSAPLTVEGYRKRASDLYAIPPEFISGGGIRLIDRIMLNQSFKEKIDAFLAGFATSFNSADIMLSPAGFHPDEEINYLGDLYINAGVWDLEKQEKDASRRLKFLMDLIEDRIGIVSEAQYKARDNRQKQELQALKEQLYRIYIRAGSALGESVALMPMDAITTPYIGLS